MLALEINNLKKSYRTKTDKVVSALSGVSLEVAEGDFFGLLGPNGAGKSTLIGIITSLVQKDAGSVKVFGNDIDTNFIMAKQHIGVVPQEFNFSMFETVENILIHQAGYYGLSKKNALEPIHYYLDKLALWDKRKTQSMRLSGGMKRRLMIARALIHKPKLLILDEPTAGVDIELRRSMWVFIEELNKNGMTIILTTHYLEEAENLCKNIAIIDNGNIVVNKKSKDLLGKLDVQTLILNLKNPLEKAPVIEGFKEVLWIDSNTIEITISDDQSMNLLFQKLIDLNIEIVSLRNKINRLEEIFLRILDKK